ncbi:TPA: trypsin-like serine protease [Vibrio vulnificus]|uniref:Trypsin-like serine protease n=2 Tax=Vibrio vulnificus TaxID=672 RepID=A0A8H9N2W5_VIBVL|nr:trypsin-like serine protease [Vibrio vulnificus]ELI0350517.1 trypsin-like serine protease [Vibrio vulnificus]MCU8224587.1 trypsin-like serine protease [Vibrio vulnificus]HAS8501028.1 trypsin-like serine protease [Vibrio vulnificus]HAS8541827.1 trypsin-like serine protease [Vibrio vulnificus]
MKMNIKIESVALSVCTLFVSISSQAVSFGEETSAKEYPYLAAIDSACTGTLIAPYTILTAEHCTKNASKVYLLTNDIPSDIGIEVAVVNVYKPDHISSPNGNFDINHFDDVAILEIASMPEGVTWLPVSSKRIPDGANFRPIGYGFGFGVSSLDENKLTRREILRKGIEESTVVTTTQCDDYYREALLRKCEQHPQYSNQLFAGQYPQESEVYCDVQYSGLYSTTSRDYQYLPKAGHSICADNHNVNESLFSHKSKRPLADDFGNPINFVSTCPGDSGSPLIYDGKVYGVASINVDADCDTNPVSSYAGLTRPGLFPWIVDTVKTIQSKHQPNSQNNRAIVFPN